MMRVLYGAIAGFCATMAMTASMRLLERQLDEKDRYPLPPREITQDVSDTDPVDTATATVLAHFGFGAAAGAFYGAMLRRPPGLFYGPVVWAVSYLGWIPLLRILKPATEHPAARNLLMLTAHLVWGACLSRGVDELERATGTIFSNGRQADRQG